MGLSVALFVPSEAVRGFRGRVEAAFAGAFSEALAGSRVAEAGLGFRSGSCSDGADPLPEGSVVFSPAFRLLRALFVFSFAALSACTASAMSRSSA